MLRFTSIARLVLGVLLTVVVSASAASAARHGEPSSLGHAPGLATGHIAKAPAHIDAGPSHVVVNVAWAGTPNGTTVTVGSSSYTFGTDAFADIQAGIDAVDAGGTVDVLPGTYLATAPGSYLYEGSGPYQFGLFFGTAKPGVTLQGVTAAGAPITSAAAVATTIDYAATNSFGSSGFFVEADHVTIRGVGIGVQTVDYTNKTIEVIGDDFTLRDCVVGDDEGSVYFDDWRATMSTSWVQSYHVLDNVFTDGNSVDVASGPGVSGPVSGRVISGNVFTMSDIYNSISFNGTTPAVGWFVYPVGGAVITGNTFHNSNPAGTIIRARGTYDAAQFDWASYWNANTFDRAACEGVAPPADVRAYAYSVYTNARHIGATIQGQVDHSVSGDVVLIHAGTYAEQVIVGGLDLTLQGAGRTATTIAAPATLPTTVTAGAHALKPIVAATGTASVELRDLTVDGLGHGNGNYEFTGVAFWNAGGKVIGCDVKGVRETPFNGDQHGLAIYAYNNTGGPYAIEVGSCNVTDYQKNGITLNGSGLTVNVHDCVVTGQGQTTLNGQNGIQVYGASGTIANCTVSGNHFTGAGWVATGLLLYGPATVSISGCTLTGNQYSVYSEDASGSLASTSVTAVAAPAGYPPVAVELFNDFTSNAPHVAHAVNGATHVPPPVQAVADEIANKSRGNATNSNAMSFTITGGCFTGSGIEDSQAIDVYSDGADLAATITGAEISGWEWGIGTGGAGGVSVDANHDRITGNAAAGYYAYGPGASTDLAALNWWGDAGGPGVGGANPVIGASVVSAPWLISGTDANPGCGFSPASDNVVAAGPAPSCISQTNTCITIPVAVERTTSDNVRGYSVTLQLSSNLMLCSGTSSVAQGGYLASVGSTQFQVVDNGGGSYTVDCAILGLPCGATAPSGTLFTLGLKKAGLDGVGTVTITDVVMRDCDNGPVAATPGAPLPVTIDTATPVAIANLATTQLRTGNDADGTTKVRVTFTAPVDAAQVLVYRAGFGHYPEYDDAGGAVPAVPAYPPAAPWTLTSVTASGQYDEPATRDFWYYVAFTIDACGNVSSVSNRSGGTLDYHLGDVVDPSMTSPVGDNQVDGADISRLGSHYGITLAPSDPYNYLDVGPTTNYSVNARPTTDNKVGFEDLMMFAINYSVVSAPRMAARPLASGHDAIALGTFAPARVGETVPFGVHLDAAGDVQGASIRLTWNADVVEPIGVEAGELLLAQSSPSVVLSPEPGTVDLALLGTGAAISGSGEVARVLFRVKAAGDPSIALGSVTARDGENQPVTFDALPVGETAAAPARTSMGPVYPNPFSHAATMQLSLAREGDVRVSVYDLAGRRVRTLVHSVQPAGTRLVTWDGRNDSGVRMAAGVYVIRLEAAGVVQSRRLQFVP